jgi:hypothetical protein
MSADPGQPSENRKELNQGVMLGAVVGQVGCLTLLIILAALFGGLWLDNLPGTKPLFTIILMIASVPVTLVLMFWVVRKATARLRDNRQQTDHKPGQGGD